MPRFDFARLQADAPPGTVVLVRAPRRDRRANLESTAAPLAPGVRPTLRAVVLRPGPRGPRPPVLRSPPPDQVVRPPPALTPGRIAPGGGSQQRGGPSGTQSAGGPLLGPGVGETGGHRDDVQWGVNSAHLYEYEPSASRTPKERYGSVEAILDSLEDIGADYVRQPGECDLVYPPDRGATYGHPFPPGGGSDPASLDFTAMDADIDAYLLPGVLYLLDRLADRPLRVVFTIVTFGGTQEPIPSDLFGGAAIPFDFVLPGNFEAHPVGEAIVDLIAGSVYALDSRYGEYWRQYTLDTTSEYKLTWIQHWCYRVALRLARGIETLANDRASRGNGATAAEERANWWGAIAGIEVFNEVNTRNQAPADAPNPSASASPWASAAVRAMEGLGKGFVEAGLAPSELPSLWLPSLASDNENQDWTFNGPFQAALASQVVATAGARGSGGYQAIVTNQDIHWYWYRRNQGIAPAVWASEVMRQAKANLASAFGRSLGVSMSETGNSVLWSNNNEFKPILPAWAAADAEFPTEDELAFFQGTEVARRACVGLASRAGGIAWHCHMALPDAGEKEGGGAAFYGTGLRQDDEALTLARDAYVRPSYWVYQLLRRLLRHRTGRVLLPYSYDTWAFGIWPDPARPDWALTVIEFAPATTPAAHLASSYAYAVFLDPAWTSVARLNLDYEVPRPYVDWVAYDVFPSAFGPVGPAAENYEFPGESAAWSYWAGRVPAGPGVLPVTGANGPQIFFTSARLSGVASRVV